MNYTENRKFLRSTNHRHSKGKWHSARHVRHNVALRWVLEYCLPGEGGAELRRRQLDVTFAVLAGEHRAATLTPVGCRRGEPRGDPLTQGCCPERRRDAAAWHLFSAPFKLLTVSLIMQRRPRPRSPTTALPRSFLTRQLYLGGFVVYGFQRFLFNNNLLQLC
jgi:hypothetical protein